MTEETIFTEAIEIADPEARAAFLDRACFGNLDVRVRLDKLLAEHAQAGSFLGSPAPILLATDIQDFVTKGRTNDIPAAGGGATAIGPYKLLEVIGEGGMGTVWLAQQQVPVKRLVALKVIKAGMDSKSVLARFEAERQALALMDHPNIAKVLDAGASPDGRPYFVMELVKGVPITKFCDERRLTPRQRLELFVPVCQAVQHAHQKGVVHRDLKPSNVLVALYDGRPVPKVIDFGIAKAAGQPLTEKTLITGLGAVVGTPEYMSPEQAELNQLDIDTRSDVYSLGILLYELLTGTTPLQHKRVKEAALLEVLRLVREEEPPRPSTRLSTTDELPSIAARRGTEPGKLSGLVRGELDWIVMKALEKDRNRRYETANGFAMDVQRYLADEAVQACPPSTGYRLRKFVRRNKRALASAAVLTLAILAVTGALGWAVRNREAQAQEAAREREARSKAVEHEVNLALTEAERWQERAKWPEALSATKRAEGLLAGGSSDEVRGRVHQFRKDLDMVLRLEEFRARRSSVVGHEALNGAYARLFTEYGIDVESLSPSEIAARIPRRAATAVRVAGALDDWAQILRDWGIYDQTHDPAAWKQLLEAARSADPDPWRSQLRQLMGQEDLNALRKLAEASDMTALPVQSLQLMGNALIFAGDGPACVAWLRRAHREHPGDPLISFDLAYRLGQSPSTDWVEVLRFAEAGLAAHPIGYMYEFVGNALSKLDRHEEAVAVFRKAIEVDPEVATFHFKLGNALYALKKPDEAIAAHRKGLSLDPQNAESHNILAWQLATDPDPRFRDPGQAVTLARRSVELDPTKWENRHTLGVAYYRAGDSVAAIAALEESMKLRKGGDGFDWFFLAMAHWQQGEKDKAYERYDLAAEWMAKYYPAHGELRGFRLEAQEVLGVRDHRRFPGHTDEVRSVAFFPDGGRALSAGRDQTLRLWDLGSGKELHRFEGHSLPVTSSAVSPDGRRALSGAFDRTMRLWDVEARQELRRFEHPESVACVALSPDGRLGLSGTYLNTVHLWDLEGGKELRQFKGHDGPVRAVAFLADGSLALSGGHDKTVRLWDVEAGSEIRRFTGHTDWVLSVALSPDEKQVASGGTDQTIRMWEVDTALEVNCLRGHQGNVEGLAFTRDGRRVVSGGSDGTIRVWDLSNGRELHCVGTESVIGVALSPDDREVLSAHTDHVVRLWALPDFGKEAPKFSTDPEN